MRQGARNKAPMTLQNVCVCDRARATVVAEDRVNKIERENVKKIFLLEI
jgi:hypothetical protein